MIRKNYIVLFFILSLACFAFAGCGNKDNENSKDNSATQSQAAENNSQKQEIVYEDADINQLMQDLTDNALAANKKYKGKHLKIMGGTLTNIDSDGDYINIQGSQNTDALFGDSIRVRIKSQEVQDAVMTIKKMTPVTVFCIVNDVGDTMGYTVTATKIEAASSTLNNSNNQTQNYSQSGSNVSAMSVNTNSSSAVTRNSNASLGNFFLGDSSNAAVKKFGEPDKKKTISSGKITYSYGATDVTFQNDIIIGIATDDYNISTTRGVRTGSALQEVINSYGQNYYLSSYNGTDLYEYKYYDESSPYMLRFAVNPASNKVKYISVRYVD